MPNEDIQEVADDIMKLEAQLRVLKTTYNDLLRDGAIARTDAQKKADADAEVKIREEQKAKAAPPLPEQEVKTV